MNKILDSYIKMFNDIDPRYIHSKSKNVIALLSGVRGEDLVYRTIRKYTNEIFVDVVMWDKKHKLTTEIDFLFMLNGYLVLVEVKEWYGTLKNHEDHHKIYCIQNNFEGQNFVQERFNPIYTVGGFTQDLIRFLKPNSPSKDLQMKRFVIYTREDLDFSSIITKSTIVSCNLIGFESELERILEETNENKYQLFKELPSWDFYYDIIDKNWYKIAVVGEDIETDKGKVLLSKIDMIVFDNYDIDKAIIKMNDGSTIEVYINRKSIKLNSNIKFSFNRIRCIKLNKLLHQDIL